MEKCSLFFFLHYFLFPLMYLQHYFSTLTNTFQKMQLQPIGQQLPTSINQAKTTGGKTNICLKDRMS